MPLGKSLAHPLYLSLQLFQVRFEFSGPLLPIVEAPMEGVGILPCSATAMPATGMAAVTRAGVPAPVVVTSMASAATAAVF